MDERDNMTEDLIEEAPLSEQGDPDGDFNARPAPVPEGQKYIVNLGLGRNGIERIAYASDKENSPEVKDRAFYKLDCLAQFDSTEQGDQDLAFFQRSAKVLGSDGRDLTSWIPKGKTLTGILHVAKLVGITPADFSDEGTPKEQNKAFYTALEQTLRTKPAKQALATRIQWQWSMKVEGVTDYKGRDVKYKTVLYGMSKANKNADGTADPVQYFDTAGKLVTKGTQGAIAVTAAAVILEIQPLN